MAEQLYCDKCRKTMSDVNFYTYKNGTKAELCKSCLTMHINNWEPDTFLWLLEKFDVPEVQTYINGVRKDIDVVKNGISLPYNNGLAVGSVNKIKVIKRIMYGRNSFNLLKAKVLFMRSFAVKSTNVGKNLLYAYVSAVLYIIADDFMLFMVSTICQFLRLCFCNI